LSKEIDEIGQSFGKEGLRFLFLFKTIKQRVQQEFERDDRKQPKDAILNDICAKAAKELLTCTQETPTEEQIGEAIVALKAKLKRC
jgi:hypothetical protein